MYSLYTIQSALKEAHNYLKNTSCSAYLDAELLLCFCLKKNKTYLYTWPEKKISEQEYSHFIKLVEQRKTKIPIAQIIREKAFWTLDLLVTNDVLIPRPDTEILVETALKKLSTLDKANILELGTGSGAISLAIASERPQDTILATDISLKALAVAQQNINRYHYEKKITLLHSNWFDSLKPQHQFDLIISNPPYIAENDSHLMHEEIQYEPTIALTSGEKGLDAINLISEKAKYFIKDQGWLMLEHGFKQKEWVKKILTDNHYQSIKTINDYSNHNRVTIGKYITNT